MAKIGFKTVLIIAFLISSSISLPLMVSGQEYGVQSASVLQADDLMSDPSGLWSGMGSAMGMFGQFGPAGEVLGQVLMMLFMQGLDISSRELLPGVFVLNASMEDTRNWSDPHDHYRKYWIPWEYVEASNLTGPEYGWGNPYCVISKEGNVTYTFTSGAAITFAIWDSDGSLIAVLQRIIDVGKELFIMAEKFEDEPPTEEDATKAATVIIGKIANVISYLLIHINDIINGDELIMLNPITYQSLLIETSADFNTTKKWYYANGTELLKERIEELGWETRAEENHDEYMLWLLSNQSLGGVHTKKWTHFAFDLIQLWIKNFHIEIDANEIINLLGAILPTGNGGGGDMFGLSVDNGIGISQDPFSSINPAKIFEGCDIEFYLFTHHLTGAFLFDDANEDGKITVDYVNVLNETTGEPLVIDGTNVQVPNSTEVTHRIQLGAVNDFDVKEPTINKNEDGVDESISWGMQMNDVKLN